MSKKQRRTVSLDPEVEAYLSRDGVNASELVNSLVKKNMSGGLDGDEIREFRKKQIRSEYEDLATRARRKIEELNKIEELEVEEQAVDPDRRDDLLEKVRMVPRDPDHPVVENAADELDMDPAQVLTEAYDQ